MRIRRIVSPILDEREFTHADRLRLRQERNQKLFDFQIGNRNVSDRTDLLPGLSFGRFAHDSH